MEPGRHYKLMEVCGGHTHSIYKYAIDDLLPDNVELVHGPGCPVCVIPWAGSTTASSWPGRTT